MVVEQESKNLCCESCGRAIPAPGPASHFEDPADASQDFSTHFCSVKCYHQYGLRQRPLVAIRRGK